MPDGDATTPARPSKAKSVAIRVIVGIFLVGAVLVALWGDWLLQERHNRLIAVPLAGAAIILALKALRELGRMLAAKDIRILWLSGAIGTVVVATLPVWWKLLRPDTPLMGHHALLLLSVLLTLIFLDQISKRSTESALPRIASTALSMLYLGVGFALILTIRVLHGTPALILFLAAVKATDIGAYFVGTAIGKHRLVPSLSPGKSWEGLIGGLIVGTAAAVGVDAAASAAWPAWATCFHWPLWQTAILGAVLGLAGQIGDLCESLLKRSAAIKDSGSMLPEFGGVLDIVDSPLVAAPVAMVLLGVLG
jgi:phosphatidate cytidylyltransferase